MPSSMMHYVIANNVLQRIPWLEPSRFLLGAIVLPDTASHLSGSYDRAHFLDFLDDHSHNRT